MDFFIKRSEIKKKQHDYKNVHFECRIVRSVFSILEESRLFSIECRKKVIASKTICEPLLQLLQKRGKYYSTILSVLNICTLSMQKLHSTTDTIYTLQFIRSIWVKLYRLQKSKKTFLSRD